MQNSYANLYESPGKVIYDQFPFIKFYDRRT